MKDLPRIPYGWAKRIVQTLRPGESCVVRPQYVVALHNAARRLGMRVRVERFREGRQLLYRMKRIRIDSPVDYSARPLPARAPKSGQWLKGEVAA